MQGLTFINCLENILQLKTCLLKTIETDMTEFVLEPWCPVGRYSEYFFRSVCTTVLTVIILVLNDRHYVCERHHTCAEFSSKANKMAIKHVGLKSREALTLENLISHKAFKNILAMCYLGLNKGISFKIQNMSFSSAVKGYVKSMRPIFRPGYGAMPEKVLHPNTGISHLNSRKGIYLGI